MPVITKILVDHGHTAGVPAWPGVQLDMPSEEALVLLGSPIGSTVAFFLVQHKAELGLKHVTSITIFRDYEATPGIQPEVQLLFRIDDVSEEDTLPEDTEMLDEGTTRAATRKRVKREDSVLELHLGHDISRVHKMSMNSWGETVLHSGGFEREL